MKLSSFAVATCISLNSGVNAFSQIKLNNQVTSTSTSSPKVASTKTFASVAEDVSSESDLDYATVKNLPFRQLQKECKERGLPAVGNTATLRTRLYEALGIAECSVDGEEENVSCHCDDG